MADVGGDVPVDAADRGLVVETPPGLARTQIEHDEAVAALVAAIDDVGDARAGSQGGVAAQVEAQVVHVAIGVVHRAWEGIRFVDGVVVRSVCATAGEGSDVDGYDFRATGLGVWHRWVACAAMDGRAACVEDP